MFLGESKLHFSIFLLASVDLDDGDIGWIIAESCSCSLKLFLTVGSTCQPRGTE